MYKRQEHFLKQIGLVNKKDEKAYQALSQQQNTDKIDPREGKKAEAISAMLLVHGSSNFSRVEECSGISGKYDEIFKNLFDSKWEDAQYLHYLLSRSSDEKYDLVKPAAKLKKDDRYDQGIYERRAKFQNFLTRKLSFEQDGLDWLRTLLCISSGDSSRVYYIAEQYDLTVSTTDILKSMVSFKVEEMEDLFIAMEEKVNFKD